MINDGHSQRFICLLYYFSTLKAVFSLIDCSHHSYILESSTVIPGSVLGINTSENLDDCLKICSQNPSCTAANFLLSSIDLTHCLLVDSSKTAKQSEIPLKEHGIYSARKICISESFSTNCPERRWSFERFPNRKLIDKRFSLKSFTGNLFDDCLNECVKHESCMAVFWNGKLKECQIASISLQSVHNSRHYFDFDEETDLYESNCVQASSTLSTCSFLALHSAGITDHFDEKILNIVDAKACENRCLERKEEKGTCRMYTYDRDTKRCYLSHSTRRELGRNGLHGEMIKSNLIMGELDDCTQFTLKCKPESMELHATSMKLFGGELRTKRSKEILCERKINPNYAFHLDLPYEKCGMTEKAFPSRSYSGIIYLKEGSTQLITIRDKTIQVHCRIHTQGEPILDQTVAVHMKVSAGNETTLRNGLIVPTGSLRVPIKATSKSKFNLHFEKNGVESDLIERKEKGEIIIEIDDKTNEINQEFTVRNLILHRGGQIKPKILIDENGCVSDREMIKSMSRKSPNRLVIKLDFDRFDEETDISYSSLVETCSINCMPECNKDLLIEDIGQLSRQRRRRSLTLNGRNVQLYQDVYRISGGRMRILMGNGTAKENKSEIDVEEISPSSSLSSTLSNCDLSCFFTILLSFLQLFLLITCICIAYFYAMQWRSHRSASRSFNSDRIQYEIRENSFRKPSN
ncbi:unnamed protein product, partial [Mesorhabditis belari]|uniref:Uncharacterized protein n=1 Tax=Mesorhabditis belari TaxID=2138241 RepID=A0AAF3FRT4_9BILA